MDNRVTICNSQKHHRHVARKSSNDSGILAQTIKFSPWTEAVPSPPKKLRFYFTKNLVSESFGQSLSPCDDNDHDTLRKGRPTTISDLALRTWVLGSWPCGKKNLFRWCTLHCETRGPLLHCVKDSAQSRSSGKWNQQAYAVTISSEFKNNTTVESSDSVLDMNKNGVRWKSVASSCDLVVWAHQPLSFRGTANEIVVHVSSRAFRWKNRNRASPWSSMMPIEFVLVQHPGQVSGIEHFFSPCIRSMDARCCKCLICFHRFFLDLLQLSSKCRCFYFIASRLFGFLWLEEIIYFVLPISFWSSHCCVCPVLGAETWISFCCFLCPSLIWYRCNSPCQAPFSAQHEIFAVFILSTAIDVLLLIHSIQSSSSSSPVSISSSVSFMKEMSLSWSQSVLELLPSAVSSSELLWLAFSSSSSSSFLLGWVFFLYFLFLWTMKRSILRWVDRIILSCSF